MNQYVQVVEEENEDPIELPCEEDSTLLLSTVVAQFPGACGLKYRNKESGCLRGLRLVDGKLFSPDGEWTEHVYHVVFPKGIFSISHFMVYTGFSKPSVPEGFKSNFPSTAYIVYPS